MKDNLQQLMKIHGNLSLSDLYRETGIPQPTLHHVLVGSTKNPRKKFLTMLANFFSISIDELTGKLPLPRLIPETIKEDLKITTLPILEWDMLPYWPLKHIKNVKELLFDKPIAANSFGLVIQSSNMEPLFPEKSLLIFEFGKSPQDRDFIVVHMKQDNNILFNRLFKDNNTYFIKQSLDDGNVKLIKLDMSIDRIIGTLIEVRIQF